MKAVSLGSDTPFDHKKARILQNFILVMTKNYSFVIYFGLEAVLSLLFCLEHAPEFLGKAAR